MSYSFTSPSSRFANNPQEAIPNLEELESNNEISAGDVVTATGNRLPYIHIETLRFDKVLGRGTSFEVRREEYHKPGGSPAYYVAVKRFRSFGGGQMIDRSKRYRAFLRELRVLMHPPLRSHGCMAQAVAHGWFDDPHEGGQPYLIMHYSQHGTLVEYLRRCKIPVDERRELALDITSALKALHESRIVHGDVKPENVLVFDNDDNEGRDIIRPQVARLSDFSGVIFEQDFSRESQVTYLGTQRYLSPEMLSPLYSGDDGLSSFDLFMKADIFSLGLLIWEVFKNGHPYIDHSLKKTDETEHDFRKRISGHEPDALCSLMKDFLRGSNEIDAESKHSIIMSEAISMCLKDSPARRASVRDIIQTLAQGIREKRPRLSSVPVRINPRNASPIASPNIAIESNPHRKTFFTLNSVTSTNLIVRHITDITLPIAESNAPVPLANAAAVKPFDYGSIDIFKMAMAEPLPRDTQKAMADQLKKALPTANRAASDLIHLQLSVMHHIGYGVEQDDKVALQHLDLANVQNPITKSLFPPVSRALSVQNGDLSYSSYQGRGESRSGSPTRLHPPRQPDTVDTLLESNGLPSVERRTASHSQNQMTPRSELITACQRGDLDNAILLAQGCPLDYFSIEHDFHNFCHWLIVFEDISQIRMLLDLIIQRGGNLRELLSRSCESPFYVPHHCMELIGTPLHWAVRTGNSDLVSLLISYGADVNVRWRSRAPLSFEPPLGKYKPSFSPLDVAVAYHLADIIDILLRKGAEPFGGDREWEYSAFHMIGLQTVPFSRFVLHGERHRDALKDTIGTLKAHCIDINSIDSRGDTPLTLAVTSFDIEPYIFRELIAAGASTSGRFNAKYGNVVIMDAKCCSNRLDSGWRTKLLSDLVVDLDMLDPDGYSALHHCALLDNVTAAKYLLSTGRVDADRKSANGLTALAYAALSGSTSIIKCLVDAGCNLELKSNGQTALEIAVRERKALIANTLIKAGASTKLARCNVLHLAVTNADQRGSIAESLLEHCANQLNDPSILDEFDFTGFTPMHYAAYYGDYSGVRALVNAGANPSIYKLPAACSLGGTPLDLATKIITKFDVTGELRAEHGAIKKKGRRAVSDFLAITKDIKTFLST
ncbi:hypothetical protein F5Y04DRAFT_274412 [Hypomontagnella monticulosa]|nr:hypothetical protein F5Y04DRAFT_274412 [Hypomontagnella monticulosa]